MNQHIKTTQSLPVSILEIKKDANRFVGRIMAAIVMSFILCMASLYFYIIDHDVELSNGVLVAHDFGWGAILFLILFWVTLYAVLQKKVSEVVSEFHKVNLTEIEEQKRMIMQASKMSALGEMMGGIAHEINTPLATIKILASQALSEVQSDLLDIELVTGHLGKIDAMTDRMAKIIKGLKTFARSGEADPMESFSVQEAIEDTIVLCGDQFTNRKVELRWRIPAETIRLECRPVEITQVLLNLVTNALDAVESLSERWIEIELREKNQDIEIRIKDSGAGIKPEVLDKIFQPFFTTKSIGKGTGIGLSISLGIIQSHHGRLYVDAQEATTCFVIELPKNQIKPLTKSA
ncbi:MAG: ATP-binding protein [Bdellovibrio sp.]